MTYLTRFFVTCLFALPIAAAADLPQRAEDPPRRAVDLVIALDVSGSMSGLIDSAKQRLWDVVNTLGRAQPQPDLRVAIVTFGNPAYGSETGFVRIDQPLTRDLDSVNETLFAFSTNGGEEYVARAIARSLDTLDWSRADDAMRVVFVAGNESAEQDPELTLTEALNRAAQRDITVNAIYCGSGNDDVATGWRQVASRTNGTFASIDQAANVVAAIETPMDERLVKLSEELNDTYIPYGDAGADSKTRQQQQDENAAVMSIGALASRVVTKASALYDSAKWDLVDAFEQGMAIDEIDAEDLPAPMQAMAPEELKRSVQEQAGRRAAIKKEIAQLDAERRDYVDEYRKEAGSEGLDAALVESLVQQAESRGFEFAE